MIDRIRTLVEIACAARTLWEVYEFARARTRKEEEKPRPRVIVCDRWGPIEGGGP